MATQQVISKGIYHGLPTFPDSAKGLTAVVTGANGISGYHMLQVLAESPERWTKIFCLSRRPPAVPGGLPPQAEHIACDFLKDPSEIASVLKNHGVRADYVFFYSYIQVQPKPGLGLWSDAEEMTRVNLALFSNFLLGLEQASIKPKGIMLQTGAKNYGLHFGPVKNPAEEWDSRVELEPNFYYPQEDSLWEYCNRLHINWNIAMPGNILGAVPDAAMNWCYPLAIYATVTAFLKQPLIFPGDIEAWEGSWVLSSAKLNGYLEEWAVLTDGAKNQKFNAVDSSAFSVEIFWPLLAGWYGVEWTAPALTDESQLETVQTGRYPPPRGYGDRSKVRYLYTFTTWAKRPEIQRAWAEITLKYDLAFPEFGDVDRIFGFLDGILSRRYVLSMNKARKLGWHGFVDSSECILEVFDSFAALKMIPPVPKTIVKFI